MVARVIMTVCVIVMLVCAVRILIDRYTPRT